MTAKLLRFIAAALIFVGSQPPAGAAGEPATRLRPGREAGTFRLELAIRVRFPGGAEPLPVEVKLCPATAVDSPVAARTIADGGPAALAADVRPGTYLVRSDVTAPEARRAYWDALGPRFDVLADGTLSGAAPSPAAVAIVHDRKIRGMEPSGLREVAEPRPVLRWEPVAGAARYSVGWIEKAPGARNPGRAGEVGRVDGPEYRFREPVAAGRVYEWYVHAEDGTGEKVGHGNAYFVTPGVDRAALGAARDGAAAAAGARQGGWIGAAVREADVLDPSGPGVVRGLTVDAVVPGSPAAAAGLRFGDVVVAVGGRPVGSAAEFVDRASSLRPGSRVIVDVRRGRNATRIEVTIGTRPTSTATTAPAAR